MIGASLNAVWELYMSYALSCEVSRASHILETDLRNYFKLVLVVLAGCKEIGDSALHSENLSFDEDLLEYFFSESSIAKEFVLFAVPNKPPGTLDTALRTFDIFLRGAKNPQKLLSNRGFQECLSVILSAIVSRWKQGEVIPALRANSITKFTKCLVGLICENTECIKDLKYLRLDDWREYLGDDLNDAGDVTSGSCDDLCSGPLAYLCWCLYECWGVRFERPNGDIDNGPKALKAGSGNAKKSTKSGLLETPVGDPSSHSKMVDSEKVAAKSARDSTRHHNKRGRRSSNGQSARHNVMPSTADTCLPHTSEGSEVKIAAEPQLDKMMSEWKLSSRVQRQDSSRIQKKRTFGLKKSAKVESTIRSPSYYAAWQSLPLVAFQRTLSKLLFQLAAVLPESVVEATLGKQNFPFYITRAMSMTFSKLSSDDVPEDEFALSSFLGDFCSPSHFSPYFWEYEIDPSPPKLEEVPENVSITYKMSPSSAASTSPVTATSIKSSSVSFAKMIGRAIWPTPPTTPTSPNPPSAQQIQTPRNSQRQIHPQNSSAHCAASPQQKLCLALARASTLNAPNIHRSEDDLSPVETLQQPSQFACLNLTPRMNASPRYTREHTSTAQTFGNKQSNLSNIPLRQTVPPNLIGRSPAGDALFASSTSHFHSESQLPQHNTTALHPSCESLPNLIRPTFLSSASNIVSYSTQSSASSNPCLPTVRSTSSQGLFDIFRSMARGKSLSNIETPSQSPTTPSKHSSKFCHSPSAIFDKQPKPESLFPFSPWKLVCYFLFFSDFYCMKGKDASSPLKISIADHFISTFLSVRLTPLLLTPSETVVRTGLQYLMRLFLRSQSDSVLAALECYTFRSNLWVLIYSFLDGVSDELRDISWQLCDVLAGKSIEAFSKMMCGVADPIGKLTPFWNTSGTQDSYVCCQTPATTAGICSFDCKWPKELCKKFYVECLGVGCSANIPLDRQKINYAVEADTWARLSLSDDWRGNTEDEKDNNCCPNEGEQRGVHCSNAVGSRCSEGYGLDGWYWHLKRLFHIRNDALRPFAFESVDEAYNTVSTSERNKVLELLQELPVHSITPNSSPRSVAMIQANPQTLKRFSDCDLSAGRERIEGLDCHRMPPQNPQKCEKNELYRRLTDAFGRFLTNSLQVDVALCCLVLRLTRYSLLGPPSSPLSRLLLGCEDAVTQDGGLCGIIDGIITEIAHTRKQSFPEVPLDRVVLEVVRSPVIPLVLLLPRFVVTDVASCNLRPCPQGSQKRHSRRNETFSEDDEEHCEDFFSENSKALRIAFGYATRNRAFNSFPHLYPLGDRFQLSLNERETEEFETCPFGKALVDTKLRRLKQVESRLYLQVCAESDDIFFFVQKVALLHEFLLQFCNLVDFHGKAT